jgi:RHS repeat-associated protein
VLGVSGAQITEITLQGNQGTWDHSDVYLGGALLATYRDSNTYFALNDWLGTKRVEVTPNGLMSSFASLPFGDNLISSGTAPDASEHHFTGKERDVESGLDYFGARYYSSNMGRFMSPDWSAKAEPVPYARLVDPQSLNLYGYVSNNPMTGIDLDGHRLMTYSQYLESGGGSGWEAPSSPLGQGAEEEWSRERQLSAEDQERAQQNAPAAHSLTNVVYNETGSLRADPNAKPGQPGSAEDLANGMQAVAEIANRVINASHPGRVAPDSLTSQGAVDVTKDPHAIDAYGRSQTAADAALAGSNISNGATLYRTRVGSNVTTPLGKSSTNPGETITQHYGPFVEGKHTVVIVVAP